MTGIGYNARGQRVSIGYGNGTTTAYGYDPQTFRLTSLTTTRPGSFTAAQQTVQALSYFYDPVGNVTGIRDDADTQNVIFFRNQRVEPSACYTYDAVYRLIAATGREHLGQTNGDAAAAEPGHQRRLVPHRPAAARRRHRDGHLHRELRLRPGREPARRWATW